MECRDLPPLTKPEIAAIELWLDAQPTPRGLSQHSAMRCVSTIRHLQQRVRALEAQSDAAYAMLAVDCAPEPKDT